MSFNEFTSSWKASYSRPLVGSEKGHDLINQYLDGCNEPCMGVSFTTLYPKDTLVPLIHEALGRLRFHAPLIASDLVADPGSPTRRWLYTTVSDYAEVQEWAKKALTVHETTLSEDEFIVKTNQTKLPYVHSPSHSQVTGFHLLWRESGVHSLLIHGTHAIWDANPTLDALYCIFNSVVNSDSETSGKDLEWGTESKNLPLGPIPATGGLRDNWEVEVPITKKAIDEALNNPQPSEGVHPQRQAIEKPGYPVRVHQVVESGSLKKILSKLKEHQLSVTVLFEAAEALATFAESLKHGITLGKDAHVTYDMSVISLQPFFVPPYNVRTTIGSSMANVPITIMYKDIPQGVDVKEQLLAVSAILKAQYDAYLANPHLPHFATCNPPLVQPNPYALFVTNIGVVDRKLPLMWPQGVEKPMIQIQGMYVGHRMIEIRRPIAHVWSIHSELHAQIQAADIYDKEYLQSFLNKILQNAMTIIN